MEESEIKYKNSWIKEKEEEEKEKEEEIDGFDFWPGRDSIQINGKWYII